MRGPLWRRRQAVWEAGGPAPGTYDGRLRVGDLPRPDAPATSRRPFVRRLTFGTLAVVAFALAVACGYAVGVYDDEERLNPFAPEPVIVWGGETFQSKREFAGWLAEHGIDYGAWSSRHPVVAARLDETDAG